MSERHPKRQPAKALSLSLWFSLCAFVFGPSFGFAQSFIVTLTETSEPPNLFTTKITQTNYPPGSPPILFQTQTAPITASTYHFTHWTLNGQRIEDFTSQSINPAPVVFTNDIAAVAHYVPANQYTADALVPDWFKIEFYNTTNINASSDLDGDGFNLGVEFSRGYHPQLFDQIVEGGISRRRSGTTLVVVDTNLVRVTATSEPFGLYSDFQILTRGTNFNFPAEPSFGGYTFTGWFVGTNRVDDSNGFSSGTISMTVSNDTTLTARFLAAGLDADADGLEDGYEMYYFNTLSNTPQSDPGGDGFDIATDILRGYHPNTFNQIVEGGISRRRSAVFSFVPAPPAFSIQPQDQTISPGTNVSITFSPQGIPPFTYQWRLNGVNIVGATNATLDFADAQPTDSGSYSIVLGNTFGFNTSTDAVLLVTSPDLGLADNIESRPTTNSASGLGSGSNVGASHQFGEPNHGQKYGSNSVWISWIAPANGIATFTTRGSSFDTVIAVYARTTTNAASVTNLTPVISDDDRGGYLTSLVKFNTTAGKEYFIAVDGFVRATGNIVLGWSFQPSAVELPVIVQHPANQTYALGDRATNAVVATSTLPLTYQWLRDGEAIPGATSATLIIPSVKIGDVGNYEVIVSNGSGQTRSQVGFLQVNMTDPNGQAQQVAAIEKLAEAPLGNGEFLSLPGKLGGFRMFNLVSSFGFSSPPARGFAGTQIYSTKSNSTGVAVAWFKLQSDVSGPLLVTTEGSEFDTYFTVYNGPSNAILQTQLSGIPFAYNLGSDYRTRRITFNATSNTVYYIKLDGVNRYGKVWLSWVLSYQSTIQPPQGLQVGHATFQVTNTTVQTVQWFFNDAPLMGQTNLVLNLAGVQPDNTGAYSVLSTNLTGHVTRDKLYLQVLPITLSPPIISGNSVLLRFGTTYGRAAEIQASSDLLNWTTIYTNNSPGATNEFVDPQPAQNGGRFYRFQLH